MDTDLILQGDLWSCDSHQESNNHWCYQIKPRRSSLHKMPLGITISLIMHRALYLLLLVPILAQLVLEVTLPTLKALNAFYVQTLSMLQCLAPAASLAQTRLKQ